MTTTTACAVQLAQHFSKLDYRRLPENSKNGVKRLLLDYLGVAIAGSQTDSGLIACRYAQADGGTPEATLIGNGVRVPAAQAAFANAISSHSLELDDIDVLALFHFSPPVFSAALAAAEAECNGKQLITALVAGCEMMERASRASNPSLRDRGYHTTPACGVFGAAIAAGKLWRLTPAKLMSALGLAAAQASGILEFQGPSMQKRFSPGPGARGGVTAARMAQFGYTGQETILEGPRGFLKAYSDKYDAGKLVEGLDEPYQLDIEFKPYACARPIHNAIDCALVIRNRDNPDLKDITKIHVARHPSWANYHLEKAPKTFHAAQMNLPYSVGVVFKEGQALIEQYEDRKLRDPVVVRLTNATKISVDPSLPRGVSCRMTVMMKDGRQLHSQVDYPKGSIQNPMTDAEIEVKFTSLSLPVIGKSQVEQVIELVNGLERCTDIRKLMKLTAKRKRTPRETQVARNPKEGS